MDSNDLCPGGISAWSHTCCVGGGDCLRADAVIRKEPHRVRIKNTALVLLELIMALLSLNSFNSKCLLHSLTL